MKTLSLSRPLILIVVGLPGSGKSFFARQFSEIFGAPLVSYNRLQFELFDKPQLNQAEQDLMRRLTLYHVDELVKTRRSFLVDGGVNATAERQKLEQIAKANGYGTLTIWLQTDDLTCRKRATKRNPKRSEDDTLSQSITESQWAKAATQFQQPQREPYMVLSGKHAFSGQAKMVLRKLTAPHTEEAETAHTLQKQTRNIAVARRPAVRPERPAGGLTRRNVIIS